MDGGARDNQDGHEVAGTYIGTCLVMAGTQQVLWIDPNRKDTTTTINRAELVGVQTWLKCISQVEHPPSSFSKLLTDSQVTSQSIQKAIKQPTSTWFNTHEPLLEDIVSRLKSLTSERHHVHLGKVKAHFGVRGNIRADLAAKSAVIDANGDLNSRVECCWD